VNRRERKRAPERLVYAATFKGPGAVADLLRAGADPNAPDREGSTALYQAAVGDGVAVARLLLAAGADPNLESAAESEGLPLCAAACWGHMEIIHELLAFGADPNRREDRGDGYSPLDWAVQNQLDETADVLRAAGARTTEWSSPARDGAACELLVMSGPGFRRRIKTRRRWGHDRARTSSRRVVGR
jgi:ankyrin repeat protein